MPLLALIGRYSSRPFIKAGSDTARNSMSKNLLMEKAKSFKQREVHKNRTLTPPEEVLMIAFLKGEVTRSQVIKAEGWRNWDANGKFVGRVYRTVLRCLADGRLKFTGK